MRSHTVGFMTMETRGAYVQYSIKTEHQYFNLGRACQSVLCPDPGDLDPILPERERIQYPRQCYISR